MACDHPTDAICPHCTHLSPLERALAARVENALDVQIGGDHYKSMAIQPVEYCHANGIGFIEGAVIKYVTRWRTKGGIDDIKKARHFLDLLIELESRKPKEVDFHFFGDR